MNRAKLLVLFSALCVLAACSCPSGSCESAAAAPAAKGDERHVSFSAVTTVPGIAAGTKELRMWIPAPLQEDSQQIVDHKISVDAGGAASSKVLMEAGPNRWWAVVVTNPPASVSVTQTVVAKRKEVLRAPSSAAVRALTQKERVVFAAELSPHKLVPLSGPKLDPLIAEVAPGSNDAVQIARAAYRTLLERMRYSKDGEGWGRGDSNWACDSRYGNCTDFHSLFMSIVRAKGVPARFTMGFPIPEAHGTGVVGGYHCWAEFFAPGIGWIPVDISEADKHPELADYYFGNLTEDRIAFVLGRDLVLQPAPSSGPQNIFIYALAEADGAPLKTERRMSYTDL